MIEIRNDSKLVRLIAAQAKGERVDPTRQSTRRDRSRIWRRIPIRTTSIRSPSSSATP